MKADTYSTRAIHSPFKRATTLFQQQRDNQQGERISMAARQGPKRIGALTGHQKPVFAVAITHDGKYIITGSGDGTARVWNKDTRKCLATCAGVHHDAVTHISVSPDETRFVTGSKDSVACVWSLPQGQPLVKLVSDHVGQLQQVAFTPDGGTVVTIGSADNAIKTWSLASGEQLSSKRDGPNLARGVNCVGLHVRADGEMTLITGCQDHVCRVYDMATGSSQATLEGHCDWIRCVSVAAADATTCITASEDETAAVWCTLTGKRRCQFSEHDAAVTAVYISEDGSTAVTGSKDRTAIVWNAITGKLLAGLTGFSTGVSAVAMSHDKSFVVVGTGAGDCEIWSL